MRLSAGLLNEFRLTLEEKWGKNQETFLAYITQPFQETPAIIAGKAFHSVVEGKIAMKREPIVKVPDGSGGTVEMPWRTYATARALYGEYAEQHALHEVWKGGVVQDLGDLVIASLGKQDVRVLTRIEDIKTTSKAQTQDDYYDDLQWQLYLMIDKAATAFRYRIFEWDEARNIKSEADFTFTRADLREDIVIDYCQRLVNFLELHGHLDRYILKPEKYFTVGLR